MPEINQNYQIKQKFSAPIQQNRAQSRLQARQMTPDMYCRREMRKDSGLIEKLYNKIKNLTGLGVGSKKVNVVLEQSKQGKASAEEVKKVLYDYNSSQENSAQLLGDAASVGVGGTVLFSLNKAFKYVNAGVKVNKPLVDKFQILIKKSEDAIAQGKLKPRQADVEKKFINAFKTTLKTLSSNKRMSAIAIGISAFAAGLTKYWTLKLNRIGSDEFKVDRQVYGSKNSKNPIQKKIYKAEKKRLNKERHKANFKNFLSGAVNGLMLPVMALGGVIGAPIFLIGNSLNRYFIASKTDKNKSIGGYAENFKNDALTIGLTSAALAVPLVKKGNFTKIFNENIKKAGDKLASATLKEADYNGISAYKQLEQMMLESPDIKSIINNAKLSTNEQITKLTEQNLFAAKFKQISGDESELARALKDNCPPTRTLEQAQSFINVNLGNGYKVSKLLGVGTVAETYLAKNAKGKDVCIKILKDKISKEKILKDKENLINIVKKTTDKSSDEKEYLIRNIDDLAEGILKEVDLKNEMDAALKIAKSTNVANVVKPIEVKNNVYVMEKANGISLASFMDINKLYIEREAAEKLGKDKAQKAITEIDKKIEALKSRMPDFKDVKFNKKDSDYLLREYQKVFIEQFHKVDKNGKAIHADIHPGNIFIDPQVLKTKKGKLFTLIDTGNVIDMGVEQSLHALNFINYIKNGNVQDIAEYVLKDAKLPSGMNEKEAMEKVSGELKKCFFDSETKLEMLNDEKVLTLTDNIMQKFDIIPNSTQLNLNKSRKSAKNSLKELENSILSFDMIDVLSHDSKTGVVVAGGKTGIKTLARNKIYESMVAKQERENLKQLSIAQRLKQKNNPNAQKTNSEDYLTYKLKQIIQDVSMFKEV